MKAHLILREKAFENFGKDKSKMNKAMLEIESTNDILTMKPIDFYTKLYNLSLNNLK